MIDFAPAIYVARRAEAARRFELTLLGVVACAAMSCQVEPIDRTRLSNRGLYSDIASRTFVSQAIEYEPDYALWSDGVQKRRWLILPPGKKIDTSDMAHWQFPVGTKVFKEFSQRGKLLETRLIERVADDTGKVKNDFFMATFVWSADQTEAVLNNKGVQNALGTEHDVPDAKACLQCHRGEPSAILGISAVQLSRSGIIDKLAARSLLTHKPQRQFPISGDEVQQAAIGYMHANCGHCHSAEGIAEEMRLRFLPEESDLPIEQSEVYKTTIGQRITDWKVHPEDLQFRVVAGDPEHSALLYRMRIRGKRQPEVDDQMPPVATERIHHEGIAAVQAWIATLPRELMPEPGDQGQTAAGAAAPNPEADGGGGAAGADDPPAGAPSPDDGAGGAGSMTEMAGSPGSSPDRRDGAAGSPDGQAGAGGSLDGQSGAVGSPEPEPPQGGSSGESSGEDAG